MKVSELMIGDWVMAEDGVIGHEKKNPVKLTSIFDEMIDATKMVPGVITSAWPGVKIPLVHRSKEMFTPIPISGKVLGNAGWQHFGINNGLMGWNSIEHWCWGNRMSYAIIVWQHDGKWFFKHHSKDGFTNISLPLPTGSFHELQHMMRLCGIEIDIVKGGAE